MRSSRGENPGRGDLTRPNNEQIDTRIRKQRHHDEDAGAHHEVVGEDQAAPAEHKRRGNERYRGRTDFQPVFADLPRFPVCTVRPNIASMRSLNRLPIHKACNDMLRNAWDEAFAFAAITEWLCEMTAASDQLLRFTCRVIRLDPISWI